VGGPGAGPVSPAPRQPEGTADEGELHYGMLPGDSIWRGDADTAPFKCQGMCTGYKNVFTGAFVNIDWQMGLGFSRTHPVTAVYVRLDNGRTRPMRAYFEGTVVGRNGACGKVLFGSVDAPARAESRADLVIECRARDQNQPSDVRLELNDFRLYERQARGWARIR
jgi:hypothetical protein